MAPSTGQAGCPFHPSIFWHKGDRDRSSPVTFVLTACIPLSPSLLRQVAPRHPRSSHRHLGAADSWQAAPRRPRSLHAAFLLSSHRHSSAADSWQVARCQDFGVVWQRIAPDVRISAWFGRELRKRTVCERFFAGNTPYRTFSGSSDRENRTFPFISANSKGIQCICLILCR